jgi:CHAT domain-containing protein
VSSESPKERWLRAEACEARYLQTNDLSALEEALSLWDGLLADADPEALTERFHQATQTKLGGALMRRFQALGDPADLDRALNLFQEAADRAEAGGREVTGYLSNLGIGYGRRYVRSGEIMDLRRSIAFLERALHGASPDFSGIALLLNNLGTAHRILYEREGDSADLDQALELLERSVEETPAGSPDRPGHLANLGIARVASYDRTGASEDLSAAICVLTEAVATTPSASPEAAGRKSNLGIARGRRYARTGDLQELSAAVDLFEAAVSATPLSSPTRPRHLSNLGVAAIELSQRTGDPAQVDLAIRAFTAALENAHEENPDLPFFLSGAAVGLSRKHEISGDPQDLEKAMVFFQEAIRRLPLEAPLRIRLLANLASSLCRRYESGKEPHDLDEAIRLQREALDLIPAGSPDLPRHLHDLAVSLQLRSQAGGHPESIGEARDLFRRAAIGGPDTFLEVALGSARAWGDWASQREEWQEAAEAYDLARQAVARLLEAQLVRPARESWLRDAQALPSREAFARLRTGDLAGAVLALEEGSARLLAESLDRCGAVLRVLEASQPSLISKYREAAERVSALERGWAVEARPPSDPELADRLRAARADLTMVAAEIRRFPGFEGFLATPTLAEVRQALASGLEEAPEALVYLATAPAGSLALVVTQEDIDGLDLDLTGPEMAKLLERDEGRGGYLSGIASPEPEERRRWLDESLTQILPVLGERVIRPVVDRLRRSGIRRIALVPNGPLALLPLHAAGEPTLLDSFTVSYAPNAASLVAARHERRSRRGGVPHIVGVGNPLPHVQPLEGARTELEAVASFFDEEKRSLLYEKAATRTALLEHLPHGTHLHFACHGRFDADAPLASRLELAGGEALTLEDLLTGAVRLDRARLAVLSACQTAVRDVRSLPDELIALPAGFLEAGVPGVVGTLWPVDDIAATLLMVRWYHFLLRGDPERGGGPMEPAEALRKAQIWLRELTVAELERQLQCTSDLSSLPRKTAVAMESVFALRENRGERLFSPRDWAAFVFLGM